MDAIRKTKVNFVRCILPVETAGQFDSVDGEPLSRTGKEVSSMNVPLIRHQLRSAEMLDAVRIHRQGGLTVALRFNTCLCRCPLSIVAGVFQNHRRCRKDLGVSKLFSVSFEMRGVFFCAF